MNIQQLILLCAILSINASLLTKNIEQEKLFTDPEHIELDKLHSAQQQLDQLTTEAPFWTSPTKGLACFTLGGLIIVGAQLSNTPPDQKGVMSTIGAVVMAGSGTYACFSAADNKLERESYKNIIYGIEKKRADWDPRKQ
jgi:hypothetical protein